MTATEERKAVKEMVCIVCPMGCRLRAELHGDTVSVTGNTCPKGEKYAVEELTNPTRTVTTSVPVAGGHMALLSVKSRQPVPKTKIPDILAELSGAGAKAPVAVGDVILHDAAGTGVDIVATRSIRIKE